MGGLTAMLSPWNKNHNEVECSDCYCWSPIGEPCWYCTERKKEQEEQTMKIEIEIPADRIANMMVSAIESGDPVTRGWIADIRTDPKAEPLWYANPEFYAGTFLIEIDEFDEDTGKLVKTHLVGDLAFAAGLKVMANKYPGSFGQIMRDDTDAPCADVFLQCVCFGEEKYA